MTNSPAVIVASAWENRRSVAPARTLFLATDLGALFQYSEAMGRWRAVNGIARLHSLVRTVSGIAGETIVLQQWMPFESWQDGDVLRVWIAGGKDGSTDSARLTVRVGPAGTSEDAAVPGLDGIVLAGNTSRSFGAFFDVKMMGGHVVKRLGASGGAGSYSGAGALVQAEGIEVPAAQFQALYLSVGIASSGITDHVFVDDASIELRTP